MTRLSLLAVVAAVALVLAACGGDDDDTSTASGSGRATRTVEVEMVDIAFEPDSIDVERGETVRFVFTNTGAVAHDAFIGDEAAQDDHEAEMDDDAMGHGGGDENAITVDPGDEAELTYTFDESGTTLIGCHQPGHYDAGMVMEVNVS